MPHAIIVHGSRGYEVRTREPDLLHRTRWQETRHQHRLLIDLWFVVLRFDWIDEWAGE